MTQTAKRVEILTETLKPDATGIRGTVHVKHSTEDNYHDNRIFFVNGRRWVLQQWFGYDAYDDITIFFAEQHD